MQYILIRVSVDLKCFFVMECRIQFSNRSYFLKCISIFMCCGCHRDPTRNETSNNHLSFQVQLWRSCIYTTYIQ